MAEYTFEIDIIGTVFPVFPEIHTSCIGCPVKGTQCTVVYEPVGCREHPTQYRFTFVKILLRPGIEIICEGLYGLFPSVSLKIQFCHLLIGNTFENPY